ncbi:hypothetical protein pb186bvf_016247 [Paramecium bursaria]
MAYFQDTPQQISNRIYETCHILRYGFELIGMRLASLQFRIFVAFIFSEKFKNIFFQQLIMLLQYKCMIYGHDEQQIIGICENVQCEQKYRRVCFDCQQIHQENDSTYLFSINYYKQLFIQQIDDLYKKEQVVNMIPFHPIQEMIKLQGQMLNTNILEEQFNQIEQLIIRYQKIEQEDQLDNEMKNLQVEKTGEQEKQKINDQIDQQKYNQKQSIQFYNEGQKYNIQLGFNLQRYSEAIDMFDQVIKFCPKFAPYFQQGNSLNDLQRYQEAIEVFNLVLEIDPRYVDALNGKGTYRNSWFYQETHSMVFKDIGYQIKIIKDSIERLEIFYHYSNNQQFKIDSVTSMKSKLNKNCNFLPKMVLAIPIYHFNSIITNNINWRSIDFVKLNQFTVISQQRIFIPKFTLRESDQRDQINISYLIESSFLKRFTILLNVNQSNQR